jgi:transposase
MTMPYDDVSSSGHVQRFEVFTGAGKRRDWDPQVKASIVAESYSGMGSVSAIARRHGMLPSQLFTWRRELRKQLEAQALPPMSLLDEPPCFVPAIVEPAAGSAAISAPRKRRRQRRSTTTMVELEMDGIAVKIAAGADKSLIWAVIEALKATR